MQKSDFKLNIQSNSTKKDSVTASKKTYERLWRIIFLGISIISAFLVNKIYIYQTDKVFDSFRKGQFFNLLTFGIPFAALFSIFDYLVHFFFDDLCEKYYINREAYVDPQARKRRCYTLVKWGYSIVYYALSSVAAFILLRKTSYFPTWLGGFGSPMNIYNDFPENSEFSLQIQVFYILQFGKHLSRTFGHLFIRAEGNYYQYALHHALSIFLITFSYTMDQWLIGTLVLLVHDFTDLTLIFARGYKEKRNRSQLILKLFYIFGFATWIICRVGMFAYSFIYSFCSGIIYVLEPKLRSMDSIVRQTLYYPVWFMAIMLMVLQVLQLFWTYYIVKSYISVSISQKIARHNYD